MEKARQDQASLPDGVTIVNGTIIVDAAKYEVLEVCRRRYDDGERYTAEYHLRPFPARAYYGVTSSY